MQVLVAKRDHLLFLAECFNHSFKWALVHFETTLNHFYFSNDFSKLWKINIELRVDSLLRFPSQFYADPVFRFL